MSNNGWVMLNRRLLENPMVKKSAYFHLWVVLLLKANHRPGYFIFNSEKVILKPGQMLTGRDKLADITGIPASTVERILCYFEYEQQIEQQKTNKYRVITIKNWEKYQKKETGGRQDGQQMDTNNKNKKKYNNAHFQTFWDAYPRKVGKLKAWEKWIKLCLSNGAFEEIMNGLEYYKSTEWVESLRNNDPRFIPHPATWLNQARWEDVPEQIKRVEPEGPNQRDLFRERIKK